MKAFFQRYFFASVVLQASVLLYGCSSENKVAHPDSNPRATAAEKVDQLADVFLAESLRHHPEHAYFLGLELDRHDGFSDNSQSGIAAWQKIEDELYRQLSRIGEEQVRGERQWVTRGILLEALESSIEQRVCRVELWNVNQLSGLHLSLGQLAQVQPLGTEELERQALARWQRVAQYIDGEAINLRQGLQKGYSAPGTVVKHVIKQLDGLLAIPFEQSPLYVLIERSGTAGYREKMDALLKNRLLSALEQYRDYLVVNYLPAARNDLSVSANPNGTECYRALLRTHTTLKRTPQQVYELGEEVVSRRTQKVIALGREYFGAESFSATVAHVDGMESGRFSSKEEVLEFSKQAVARAANEVPKWFSRLPDAPVTISPFPEYLEGTGGGAHYEGPGEGKPEGTYWIPLYKPQQQRRGRAEVTGFHETYPGHHLQVAIAQELEPAHPAIGLVFNSGFVEGWGRYAEELAEEMGLYSTRAALIFRRTWPARGMVVDPGVHAFGWTRQQAIDYIEASGNFSGEVAEAMVDRIAIMPGQLTSYDSGGLEILALRNMAESELGASFDIKEFHDRILENGSVTLPMLRSHILHWIENSAY